MRPAADRLADRYILGPELGAGGMGVVYRAWDEVGGREVAVKIVAGEDGPSPRFAAEVATLAQLSHPGIVGYVGHGLDDRGRPFLVMELLEGEDLASRLVRGPLPLEDALTLVRRAASALAQAHAAGIVHRDLKPSNLYLRGGRIEDVAILDFGIARRVGAAEGLTRTGKVVGTPDYMAPEQARGARDVGPAADVFALGCVLYRCLAGRAPFAADHLVATLARILFEPAPSLARARPDLPVAVVALVDRMLEKQPDARPPDATALLREFDALGALGEAAGSLPEETGVSAAELERVTVLLLTGLGGPDVTVTTDRDTWSDDADPAPADPAPADPAPADPASPAASRGPSPQTVLWTALVRQLAARGAVAERLADGSVVATFAPTGSAADQAVVATVAALNAVGRGPGLRAAVATARQVSGAGLPIGEALERTAALLAGPDAADGRVLLDPVTAGLVDGRLATGVTEAGTHLLVGEPVTADVTRPLLGRPTPFVGRETEIGILEMEVDAALDEEVARAVVVLGAAGVGKSRLRHELVRRLARRAEEGDALVTLDARGELLRAGTPYGVVADLLRRRLEVDPAAPAEVARDRLVAALGELLGQARAREAAELFGEILDLPFPDEGSVRLRTARQDARVLQARLAEAFIGVLAALAGAPSAPPGAAPRSGVVLLLEDLHWGDRASLDLLGHALRALSDRPLVLVAFARPELRTVAPGLWKDRALELPLGRLPRRACEQLVRRVAGSGLDAEAVARVVAQSDGNALFLEELVRAACLGRDDSLPETVLAMLQARIGRLDPSERRVLRAASVYAREDVDRDAILAVLGPDTAGEDLDRWLLALTADEILSPARDRPGTFVFRHGLLREAAYGLMVEADRRLGHRLAAGWLRQHGAEACLIAEHLHLSGRGEEAGPWFVRAAQQARDRDDFAASERLARRGRPGATGEARGALAALEAVAAGMRWDWGHAVVCVAEARPFLVPGQSWWALARRVEAYHAGYQNDPGTLADVVADVLATDPAEDALLVYADAIIHIASSAIQCGRPELGRALLARFEALASDLAARYPTLDAWHSMIRCSLLRHTDDALGPQLRLLAQVVRQYEEAGAPRMLVVLAQDVYGEVECRAGVLLGAHPAGRASLDAGTERLRGSFAAARDLGVGFVESHARLALANGLAMRSEPDAWAEAEALARHILATPGVSLGYQAMARDVLATVAVARGDVATAEAEARVAITLSPHTPVRRWLMVAHLAQALVADGRAAEAEGAVAAALAEVEVYGGGAGYAELPLREVAVETAPAELRAERAEAVRRYREAQERGLGTLGGGGMATAHAS